MAYQITVHNKESYLLFIVEGFFEFQMIHGVLERILKEQADTQIPRVLLDIRELQGNPSLWERFQFATILTALYLKARAQNAIPTSHYAVVGREPLIDPSRFGQKVARNRGISVGVFSSEVEAQAWLKDP